MSSIKFEWVDIIDLSCIPTYMDDGYQSLLAAYDGCQKRLLKLTVDQTDAYLPIFIKDIGNEKKEAYSAYGYGGLLGKLTLEITDVRTLQNFLAAESVVSLFIRHSPFLSNQSQWPHASIELNRRTYAAQLFKTVEFDVYAKQMSQKIRWSINHALRNKLEVKFFSLAECSDLQIKRFYNLYAHLMQKKKVSDYYLFSEGFFAEHALKLGSRCELAEITDPSNGHLLAGAFFILDHLVGGWTHYHLSAATPEVMRLQGMEFLLASAMYRYGNMGYRMMHLGGGHAFDESDGLSRFKSKFSDTKLDFYCTKLVCDDANYIVERNRMPLNNPRLFLISDARS